MVAANIGDAGRRFPPHLLVEHYDFALRPAVANANDGSSPTSPSSYSSTSHAKFNSEGPKAEDVIVFIALESLGTLAITLNVCLCVVLVRHKYVQRASFVLMLSLALADVLHGLVTTCFFYPPILLRQSPVPSIGVRLFNIIDWTAWSITITHMSAICLDRLLAIMVYGRYNQLVTVERARKFTMTCWVAFTALNSAYILARFCCLITPLREIRFYTFGYGEFESDEQRREAPFSGTNVFKLTYTPLEMCTLAVLSISNPITLVQLYRRHKRKMALRVASTMLLEVSMRMGSKHVNNNNNEVQNSASRRANRQQQRILLQISVVAIIFYLYMSAYYLLYHVLNVSNKWVVLFNSFFYSTTHMINPVIYFSLNKDMRAQLIRAIADFLHWLCCVAGDARLHASSFYGGRNKRGGGAESSSGGSPLRKYSPGGTNNGSAPPGCGWTLRLPPCGAKRRLHQHLSPVFTASERRHLLLRVPIAPPPSVASAPSVIERTPFGDFLGTTTLTQQQQQHQHQLLYHFQNNHHDSNNNINPMDLSTNNGFFSQTRQQQQHSNQLAGLAFEMARAASRELDSNAYKNNKQKPRRWPKRKSKLPAKPHQNPVSSLSLRCVVPPSEQQRQGSNLTKVESLLVQTNNCRQQFGEKNARKNHSFREEIFAEQRQREKFDEEIPLSNFNQTTISNGNNNNNNINNNNNLERRTSESRECVQSFHSSKYGTLNMKEENVGAAENKAASCFSVPNSERLRDVNEASTEALQLDLVVDTWSVEEKDTAPNLEIRLRREALDGLTRLRGLGSFLAEQLSAEAEKHDRHWGSARRQRNSLLDALIRALASPREGEKEGETCNERIERRTRNGLLSAESAVAMLGKKSHSLDSAKTKPQQKQRLSCANCIDLGATFEQSSLVQNNSSVLMSSKKRLMGEDEKEEEQNEELVCYELLREEKENDEKPERNEEGGKEENEEEREMSDDVIFL